MTGKVLTGTSIKKVNENADIEKAIDVEAVIRYFVMHNFVANGDSYTGKMVHKKQ